MKINYSPKTTFLSLVMDMANVINLWHGITFIALLQVLFIFCSIFENSSKFFKLFSKKFRIDNKFEFEFKIKVIR